MLVETRTHTTHMLTTGGCDGHYQVPVWLVPAAFLHATWCSPDNAAAATSGLTHPTPRPIHLPPLTPAFSSTHDPPPNTAAIGVMATVSGVELWWHSAAQLQDFVGVTACVLGGAALFAVLDPLLPKPPETEELLDVQQPLKLSSDVSCAAQRGWILA